MSQETNTPAQGEEQNPQDNQNTPDFESRLQSQSAILGKVVNQSNNFSKELQEMKEMMTQFVSAKKEEPESKPKEKVKVTAEQSEQQLSFDKMQERLAALEAKDAKKSQAAKKNTLSRSLERHGVDPNASDLLSNALQLELGEALKIDDSGEQLQVTVDYAGETISVDKYAEMWLQSDAGSPFKTGKKSPTPKISAKTPSGDLNNNSSQLNQIEFAKRVAQQFVPGADREEAIKNAKSFRLNLEE